MTETEPNIQLEASWQCLLETEFKQAYMQKLKSFLQSEKAAKKRIYPKGGDIFRALNAVAYEKVKVVILGQDPYHGDGQAHGLCFSVPPKVAVPPSLINIYKELESDLRIQPANHGYLEKWAQQGVLLLNSVLTVQAGLAASHQGKGWEQFTDKVIALLNEREQPIVFMLWGAYAQRKGAHINDNKHLVLKAPHPSPLSAYRGFLGCKHFSSANTFLTKHGINPINWCLN